MERIKLTFVDGNGFEKEKKLVGEKVGYHLEHGEHEYWTIWADGITFAVPLSRVCHVEVDKTGEED